MRWWMKLKDAHIENLSPFDNNGNSLDDNWVRIGNRYWFSNDLDEIESDEGLGNLIFVFSYHIDDRDSRYYGEEASLWIYDIEPLKQETGLERDSIYRHIAISLSKDTTSIWKITDRFLPFIALETGPRLVVEFNSSEDGSKPLYEENFIILANDRIYRLNISNDMIKVKGMQAFNMFDKRCLSIANSIDLKSYHEKEIEELASKEIQEKKDRQKAMLIRIIYSILTFLGVIFIVLSFRRAKRRNLQAKKYLYYIVICTVVAIIAMGVGVFLYPHDNDTFGFLMVMYTPLILVNSFISLFFAQKATEKYNNYSLIPEWLSSSFHINNEFRKRLLMIFLIFPFFFIVPIPYVGLFCLVCYLFPVSIILGIIWIIVWIREGKKIDNNFSTIKDSTQSFCRHCGKLIDANSEFCRHCGKKL